MPQVECITLDGHKKMVQQDRLVLRPAVYAVVVHERKVLLVRMRHSGKYYAPGGGVNVGEKIEHALKRELREETGIEVQIERFARFKESFFYHDPSNTAYHGLNFYYICKPQTLELLNHTQVQDEALEEPLWVQIQGLKAADFQAHGDTMLELCREIGA